MDTLETRIRPYGFDRMNLPPHPGDQPTTTINPIPFQPVSSFTALIELKRRELSGIMGNATARERLAAQIKDLEYYRACTLCADGLVLEQAVENTHGQQAKAKRLQAKLHSQVRAIRYPLDPASMPTTTRLSNQEHTERNISRLRLGFDFLD